MAHKKVFGVCENKCQVEVSPKSERFELIGAIPVKVGTIVEVKFYKYKNMILVQCSGEWATSANVDLNFPDGIPKVIATFQNSTLLSVKGGTRKLKLYGRYFDKAQLMFIVDNDALSVSCDVSKTGVAANEKVVIKAEADGGTYDYTYCFKAHDLTNDTWNTLNECDKLSTFVWVPTVAGNYEILVTVKDSDNVSAESDLISIEVV